MKKNKQIIKEIDGGKLILSVPNSKRVAGFSEVLDYFLDAKKIFISTYSLASKPDDVLYETIVKASNQGADVTLVVNIPYNMSHSQIRVVLRNLEALSGRSTINIYVNSQNHSKIIATEKVVYIGSANYSAGTSNRYEAGVILRNNPDVESFVADSFTRLIKASKPYKEAIRGLKEYFSVRNKIRGLMRDCEVALWDFSENKNARKISRAFQKLAEKYEEFISDYTSLIDETFQGKTDTVIRSLNDLQSEVVWSKRKEKSFEDKLQEVLFLVDLEDGGDLEQQVAELQLSEPLISLELLLQNLQSMSESLYHHYMQWPDDEYQSPKNQGLQQLDTQDAQPSDADPVDQGEDTLYDKDIPF